MKKSNEFPTVKSLPDDINSVKILDTDQPEKVESFYVSAIQMRFHAFPFPSFFTVYFGFTTKPTKEEFDKVFKLIDYKKYGYEYGKDFVTEEILWTWQVER